MFKIYFLFLFFFPHQSACNLSLDKKREEFDAKYSMFFRMPLSDEPKNGDKNDSVKKLYEMHKLNLEHSIFTNYVLEYFDSIKMNELNSAQKAILKEKFVQFGDQTLKGRTLSVANNCEKWKIWRGLRNNRTKIILPISNKDSLQQIEAEESEIYAIDCVEMEEMVHKISKQKNSIEEKLDYFPKMLREYVNDCQLAHNEAIKMLLKPLGDKQKEGHQITVHWKFTEFFDDNRIKTESLLAHNLRKMGKKCREEAKCQEINQLKNAIKKIVGPSLFLDLECQNPLAMSLDITDDEQLVMDYTKILTKDPLEASAVEINLTMRMYFAKIMEILSRIYYLYLKRPKFRLFFASIEERIWNNALLKVFNELNTKNEYALALLFGFWHKLLLEYNKMPTVGPSERITAFSNVSDRLNEGKLCIISAIRAELYDAHAQNMVRLYEKGNNLFSNLLDQCQLDGPGHKFRLWHFFTNGEDKNNSFSDLLFIKLKSKYPTLKKMLRFELNDEQIMQIKIKNYLKIVNAKIDEKTWTSVKYLLNIFAFYQWYTFWGLLSDPNNEWKNLYILSIAERTLLDNHFFLMEILMNGTNEIDHMDPIEQNYAPIIVKLFDLKTELFVADQRAQKLLNLYAVDSLYLFLMKLHETELSDLLRQNEFTEQLKNIQIDANRMAHLICTDDNSEVFKHLLMKSNGIFVGGGAPQNAASEIEELTKDVDTLAALLENVEKNSAINTKNDGSAGDLDFDTWMLRLYQGIMMYDGDISDEVKAKITINAMYFHNRSVIIDVINEFDQIVTEKKNVNQKMMKDLIVQLKGKADECKLYSFPIDEDEKRKAICLIKQFMPRFVENVTKKMGNAETFEQSIAFKRLRDLFNKPTDKKYLRRWEGVDCDDRLILQELVAKDLANSANNEMIHLFAIIRLFKSYPHFVKFVNANAFTFPGICHYATIDSAEIIELVKSYLLDDDVQTAFEWEAFLGIKYLFKTVIDVELNTIIKGKELAAIRAEVMAMMFRMTCPLFEYYRYIVSLSKMTKKSVLIWQTPYGCFTTNFEQNVATFRSFMSMSSFDSMLSNLLPENYNELVPILRDKIGTFKKLQNLLGDEILKLIWNDTKEIRGKLLNEKFFNDKKRLIGHYYGVITNQCQNERAIESLMADLMMLGNYSWNLRRFTTNIKLRKVIDEKIEHFWLILRISYDEFYMQKTQLMLNAEQLSYASFKQQSIISSFLEFSDKLKKKRNINGDGLAEDWHKMEQMALENEAKNWEEAAEKGKMAQPNETMQRMHFKEFQNLMETFKSSDDEQLKGQITALLADLRKNNNNSRENVLSLLRMDERDEFLQQINGKLNENELEINKKLNENIEEIFFDKEKKRSKKRNKKGKGKIDAATESTKSGSTTAEGMGSICAAQTGEKGGEDQKGKGGQKNNNKIRQTNSKNFGEKSEQNNSTVQQKAFNSVIIINEEILSKELYKFATFKDFCEETKLHDLFKAFIGSPSDEKLLILEQAVIILEIKQRLEVIDQFENFEKSMTKKDIKAMLIRNFDEILQNKRKNQTELVELQSKLRDNLTQTLSYYDNFSPIFYENKFNPTELKMHFTIKHLAYAILNCCEIEKLWTKSINKKKKEKLLNILLLVEEQQQQQMLEVDKLQLFEQLLIRWGKMSEQIKIDKEMYENFVEPNKWNSFLMPNFPKMSQPIRILFGAKSDDENYNKQTNSLDIFISQKSPAAKSKNEFDQKIMNVINSLRRVFNEWSDKRTARLLVNGSLLLGTHTFDSDIDLICVVPGKAIRKSDFFGKLDTECNKNKCTDQTPSTFSSLYCRLCENQRVAQLVKVTYGTVSMLKLKFDGIDVDIAFVSIPGRKNMPAVLKMETLEKYVDKLITSAAADEPNKFERQIRTLTSHCSTLFIKNLLMEEDGQNNDELNAQTKPFDLLQITLNPIYENFRLMLIALKLWAKSNFIYSNKFGYLNGVSLTIMATKIVLLYPNAPILFLMEKFFLIFTTRPIKVPIKIKLNNVQSVNKSQQQPHIDEEKKYVREEIMRILTPSAPEQNAAKFVTHSTERTIRKNMLKALAQIRKLSSQKVDWSLLLDNPKQFVQMFEFFILINCVSETEFGAAKFCQFVESRIRLQLVFDIDKRGGNVEAQLNPQIYKESCATAHKSVETNFGKNYCKVWLVGLNPSNLLEYVKKELPFFDLAIKRAYLKYNPIVSDDNESANAIKHQNIEEAYEQLKCNLNSFIVTAQELNNGNAEK